MHLFHLAMLIGGALLAGQLFPSRPARQGIAAGLMLGASLAYFWWRFTWL